MGNNRSPSNEIRAEQFSIRVLGFELDIDLGGGGKRACAMLGWELNAGGKVWKNMRHEWL